MLKIGDPAPKIFATDQNGNQFSLDRLQGRPVVLACLGGTFFSDSVNGSKLLADLAPRVQAARGELVAALGVINPWPLSRFLESHEIPSDALTFLDDSANKDISQIFAQPRYELVNGEAIESGTYSPIVVLSSDQSITWISQGDWIGDFEDCASKLLQALGQ